MAVSIREPAIERIQLAASCLLEPNGISHSAIDAALEDKNELRGYILDDQGRLRKHVAIFVDGNMIRDRLGLSDLVHLHSEVFVVQALSGG